MAQCVSQQWGEGGVRRRIVEALQASGLTEVNARVEA